MSDAALAVAQGRICEPEEVAAAALFLASDEARFINATDIVIGYGNGAQANDQTVLGHALAGFGDVTLAASGRITANNQQALSVYATDTSIGKPGSGGNLTLDAPLITTDAGAVLQITAGGSLTATAPATPASSTSPSPSSPR